MNQNYAKALAYLLKTEGGFNNDPLDPGGATNFGITQREYDSWRHRQGEPLQSVALISGEEVVAIYKADYWDKVSGDQLPSGVDYCVFDFAVNSGVVRAARYLQEALGVTADGIIGPKTIAAAAADNPVHLIAALSTARLDYLEGLKTFGHFGHGWMSRVDDVETRADAMAA